MKKSTLLAFGMALLAGTAVAQNAQEVTYVEDPAQGYLFNRFKDNWFIQLEGGAGWGKSFNDSARKWSDRFAPAAHIYVGKWFSPILGARIGGDFMSVKGASTSATNVGCQAWEPISKNGKTYYKTKENFFGGSLDVMLNLTQWWCGYKPNRVYEAYVYAGGGGAATFQKDNTKDHKWVNAKDYNSFIRVGLTQNFNLSKRFALGLDLRGTAMPNSADVETYSIGHQFYLEALLSATIKLGKTTWNAPVVPVCPPAENCDEYRARLQAADARIADLEAQLKACLSRPAVEKVVETKAPLATIYYPCNVYRLTSVDRKVLESVANVMKADTSVKYTLTGWADNYTGNDAINVRLRHNRVDGVKAQLVKYGVNADQLDATINNGNRVDLGEKCLTLDRCVTIEAK